MKNHRILVICLLFISLASFVQAQSSGAARANQAALEAYMSGNYEEAAQLYAQLVKDYPTDGIVTAARLQLGFSNFFLGNFAEAQKIMEASLKDPALPAELKPVAMAFLPQVLSAQASTLPAADPKRKAGFEEAIKKFDEFLKEFPTGEQAETVMFGRALANYQIANYTEAVANLEANLQAFPQSPSILDSQNLLAIALATLGSQELAKGDAGDREKGFANLERAVSLLQDIIDKKTDLTLVNDAQFQLAEILFNRASFSPEEERPALYEQAMQAYRSVSPIEEMITLQEAKIARFPERRNQLLLQRNEAGMRALTRELEREQRRLGELGGKADQISTATLKMGEIYFNKGDYNRSRVVLRHITPFLENPEDQKRAQYFLTMTYAMQNVHDQAVANYEKFQAEHKGDPMAQNLPLAIGNIFLNHPDPSVMDPEKAIAFFDESLTIYPEGQLLALTTVSKAMAQTRLNKMDEAEQTFKTLLASDPKPEVGVIATMGLADIFKMTGQWDNAIAEYQKVLEKYGDQPQATDAQFWIALSTQQKGMQAEALPLLQKFLADHPESAFVPTALYSLAGAQIATGQRDDGMKTYAELAEKHPDSAPAPFTYFMRAQVLGSEQKPEEVNAILREFIAKYPESEHVFSAYDTIGQNAFVAGQIDDSIAVYREFLEKYPATTRSPDALLKIADYEKIMVERLGRYGALNDDERQAWEKHMSALVEAVELMLQQYPESPQVALALGSLLAAQNQYLAAEIKSPEQVEDYFKGLAEASSSSSARSKILFTLASFVAERDTAQALAIMEEAYDPAVLYAPADVDFFGLALIKEGKGDKAAEVFAKLAADYPNPPNVEPQQAPANIQQAQAVAMFGQGKVAQTAGDSGKAAELYKRLKELYPWSPKVLEAEFGIAEDDVRAGRLEDALRRVPGIIRSPNATPDLRANTTMLGAEILIKRAQAATDDKARDEALKAATDHYLQIAQFYPDSTLLAAEGLWKGGQLLEQQAAKSTDAAFKQRQAQQARRAYDDLIKNYPNSQYVPQARERLQALGS